MPIVIELPQDLERDLRSRMADLDVAAKEAFAVELYRQRKLNYHQLSRILGLSRLETEAVLKRHEVFYDLTAADVNREAEELRQLRQTDDHRR